MIEVGCVEFCDVQHFRPDQPSGLARLEFRGDGGQSLRAIKASLSEREDALVLEPQGPATASVVWLHGLGADGYDFLPFAQALGLAERGVRVLLPHAPRRPVTINGGYVMRAWYDVHDPDLARDPDEGRIRRSVDLASRAMWRAAGDS